MSKKRKKIVVDFDGHILIYLEEIADFYLVWNPVRKNPLQIEWKWGDPPIRKIL